MSSEEANSEDEEIFYPIVDIQEGIHKQIEENIEESFDSSNEKLLPPSGTHLKVVPSNEPRKMTIRRKLEDDLILSSELDRICQEKQIQVSKNHNILSKKTLKAMKKLQKKGKMKMKIKKKKLKKIVKDRTIQENGFEFCILKGLDIKEEPVSGAEKTDNESEDDVPLARFESKKDSWNEESNLCKRTYAISAIGDNSFDNGKLQKLTIKKVKKEIPSEEENEDEIDEGIERGTAEDLGEGIEEGIKKGMKSSELKCKDCNKDFKNLTRYNAHMTRVHQKPFYCSICLKSFRKRSHLEDHFNSHTGHRPYSCYICGKMFKTASSLKKHNKIFHTDGEGPIDKKGFSCHICSKQLSSATCLEEHVRLHTGEKPINCELCGKLFTRERDLKLHMNLHQESWKCDLCQRCFITPFKLKEHYRSHTGELPYECDKCDRKFARVADFRYHIGTHLGLKPYSCEVCGMRFTTSSSVTRHRLNMHQAGPRPFKCEHCGKRFHTQTRLNTHDKNHENKRKYSCTLCPATRSSAAELAKHAAVHGGDFRCDTCHRGLASAAALAAHSARHELAGKPYACFVCSLGYRSAQSLNKHLANVHGDEDVPKIAPQHLCTLCGQVFELKDKLNRHLKDSHIVLVMGDIIPIEVPHEDSKLDKAGMPVEEDKEKEQIDQLEEQQIRDKDEELIQETLKISAEAAREEQIKEHVDLDKNLQDKVPLVEQTVISEKVDVPVDTPVGNESSTDKQLNTAPIIESIDKDASSNILTRLLNMDQPIKKVALVKEDVKNINDRGKEIEITECNIEAKKEFHKIDGARESVNSSAHKKELLENRVSDTIRNASSITIPHPFSDGVKDLTSATLDAKLQKSMLPRYDNPYMRIPYNDPVAAITQHNKLLQSNSYRNVEDSMKFDSFPPQIQTSVDHAINPWFLSSKPVDKTSVHREMLQRYGEFSRLPRLDATAEQVDYSNFQNHRLQTNQRANLNPPPQPVQQRDNLNDRIYSHYFDEDNILNRKNYHLEEFNQKQLEDRRKYNATAELSRQTVRNYQHQNLTRDYNAVQSPLSVRDLSNSSAAEAQQSYAHQMLAANTPHNFFRDFRDLQQRMFGPATIPNYHPSRHIPISGMDMTRQIVNPLSPAMSYNQNSPHNVNLEHNNEMSPVSRQSYESNQNVANSPGFPNNVGRPVQNGETNKDGGSQPYEMRAATT